MSDIKDLDPSVDLEARMAVVSMLGQTLAQLKEIDKNIVGSSTNIAGQKLDLRKALPPVHSAPQVAQPVVEHIPVATVVNAGINVQPVQQIHASNIVSQAAEDPNQLVFDFTKKITPDTINDKLDRIMDKLDKIIDLQKKVLG